MATKKKKPVKTDAAILARAAELAARKEARRNARIAQDAELKAKLAAGPGPVTDKGLRALQRRARYLVSQLRPEIFEALADEALQIERDTTPIAEALSELNDEALTMDGFEGALIGIAERCGQPALAVYDRKKCIKILMNRDEMTEEEADEYFDFNVAGAWVGEMTPITLDTMDY